MTWPVEVAEYGSYQFFLREVGGYLGFGYASAAWDLETKQKADSIVQSGVYQFYYPPPIEEQGGPHVWSFLTPVGSVTTANGTSSYDLPADFSGVLGDLTYSTQTGTSIIPVVSEEKLRQLIVNSAQTGNPAYAAIRPKTSAMTAKQAWELVVYPIPTAATVIKFRYSVFPVALSAIYLYPLGGPQFAAAMLQSCLAVAELRVEKKNGPAFEQWMQKLAAAIQLDIRSAKTTADEIWPYENPATDLAVNRSYLQRMIGLELDYGPNPLTWTHLQTSTVDAVMQSGLRMFYSPPVIPGERYAHEWSFMRPAASLSTSAVYDTGSVTIASGVVTLAGAGAAWPSNAADGELVVDGETYPVSTRDTSLQITLNDTTVTASAGTTYSLCFPTISLPSDFASLDGPMTFRPGGTYPGAELEIVPEHYIRVRRQAGDSFGRPQVAAIRPKAHDATVGTRYELMVWPTPDDVYSLDYRYRVNPSVLTSVNTMPYGGVPHAETILAACQAAAESHKGKPGPRQARFFERIVASVSHDRKASSPSFVGYNGDKSDDHCVESLHGEQTNVTTYNGVAY